MKIKNIVTVKEFNSKDNKLELGKEYYFYDFRLSNKGNKIRDYVGIIKVIFTDIVPENSDEPYFMVKTWDLEKTEFTQKLHGWYGL